MAACGTLVGYPVLIQFHGEIAHLVDAGFQIVEFGILVQADSKGVHVTTVHASVSKVAFELHAEAFGTFIPVFPAGGYESAHVDNTVFFGTHRHTVGKVKHLVGDFLYALIAVTFFSHFDKVGIFRKACRVKENGLAVLVGNGADFAQVLHGNRLAACSVVGYGDDDERYPFAMFL